MADRREFKPAREIIAAANTTYVPRSGEAESLPLPQRGSGAESVDVAVLYYREGMRPREETVYPPHHMVKVDALTGDVRESKECAPADFGVDGRPGVATRGFGLDPLMPIDEFWERTDRFMSLSSGVWELYADGSTSLDDQSLETLREYNACFRRIAKAPLLPYYEAIAAEFFEWMGKVLV